MVNLAQHGINKIAPNKEGIYAYLEECTHYTDKRCFNGLSHSIYEFCENKDLKNMGQEQLCAILDYFDINPKWLYSTKDKASDKLNYYCSATEINSPYGPCFALGLLGDEVFKFYNSFGDQINISHDLRDEIDKISWSESSAIEKYEILADGNILIWFIGRETSWAKVIYNGFRFLFIDGGSDFAWSSSGSPSPHKVIPYMDDEKHIPTLDLTCRIPFVQDLKAYLHQIIQSNFVFGKAIGEKLKPIENNAISLQIEQMNEWELRKFLYENGIYPSKILFFNKKLKQMCLINGLDNENKLPFYEYPTLFTNVESVSFDSGGLLVMQFFGEQIYKLYNSEGKFLTDFCHDLDLLTQGRFVCRSSGNSSGFEVYRYDLEKGTKLIGSYGHHSIEYKFQPLLKQRDLIPEMFYPNIGYWREINKSELLDKDFMSYSMTWITKRSCFKKYEQNPALLISAMASQNFVFSLLPLEKQLDKNYVLQLLSEKCEIFNYLDDDLKFDKDVLSVALKETNLGVDILTLAPVELQNNKSIILLALTKTDQGEVYMAMPNEYKEDIDFAAEIIHVNWKCFDFMSETFKSNEKLIQMVEQRKKQLELELKLELERKEANEKLIQMAEKRKKQLELEQKKAIENNNAKLPQNKDEQKSGDGENFEDDGLPF